MKDKTIASRAQAAKLLEKRIAENVRGQRINLVQWIFKSLRVKTGWNVLELCCGTGSQTLQLLELVGASGRVIAVDVSSKALEKLRSKVSDELSKRLTTVESKMESFPVALKKLKNIPPSFDLVFCAYGLYYSEYPEKTLQDALKWLKAKGRVAIIGPYRSNNAPLFELLCQAGVEIPPFVKYTSQDFMEHTVIPWAIGLFRKITLYTVVNHITWSHPKDIINYWKNSTFYEDAKLSAVKQKVYYHFQYSCEFTNEKWIMIVEMAND